MDEITIPLLPCRSINDIETARTLLQNFREIALTPQETAGLKSDLDRAADLEQMLLEEQS